MNICRCQAFNILLFAVGSGHWLIWNSNGRRTCVRRKDTCYMNAAMMSLFGKNEVIYLLYAGCV